MSTNCNQKRFKKYLHLSQSIRFRIETTNMVIVMVIGSWVDSLWAIFEIPETSVLLLIYLTDGTLTDLVIPNEILVFSLVRVLS